ncbi:MAG: hypothetical protein JWN07_3589 [Hyphomicrobiales bacterium]|nr:hypothetical protein [Hyphomicrobiales bacterium]
MRSSFHRTSRALRLVALLALCAGSAMTLPPSPVLAQAAPVAAESTLEPLEITTASGSHKFFVEVMRDDNQRARGLMYRRSMPQDRGMLFDFKREEPVSMWMKNTYLSLDMLFIDRTGRVVNVAENTEPLSERIIPSGAPVFAVLELNAGTARRIGLKVGDKLRHSMFR